MIDWSRCPEVESTADTLHGAWRVKGHCVPVQALLDNYAADETPLAIARMFTLPAATVRRVLRFALREELVALYEDARLPIFPRDYELEGVIVAHKLAALSNRRDKKARQIAEIEKALKRRRRR